MPARLRVVAGILRDPGNRVLLTERLHDHPFAGLWEFPGGKIEEGESADSALRRELREELGIDVVAAEPFLAVEHDYPDRSVALEFFLVTAWNGTPAPMLGQRLRWSAPQDIATSELLPANAAVLTALRAL
jgi:8-oxo-dGTP diphosphatase